MTFVFRHLPSDVCFFTNLRLLPIFHTQPAALPIFKSTESDYIVAVKTRWEVTK